MVRELDLAPSVHVAGFLVTGEERHELGVEAHVRDGRGTLAVAAPQESQPVRADAACKDANIIVDVANAPMQEHAIWAGRADVGVRVQRAGGVDDGGALGLRVLGGWEGVAQGRDGREMQGNMSLNSGQLPYGRGEARPVPTARWGRPFKQGSSGPRGVGQCRLTDGEDAPGGRRGGRVVQEGGGVGGGRKGGGQRERGVKGGG